MGLHLPVAKRPSGLQMTFWDRNKWRDGGCARGCTHSHPLSQAGLGHVAWEKYSICSRRLRALKSGGLQGSFCSGLSLWGPGDEWEGSRRAVGCPFQCQPRRQSMCPGWGQFKMQVDQKAAPGRAGVRRVSLRLSSWRMPGISLPSGLREGYLRPHSLWWEWWHGKAGVLVSWRGREVSALRPHAVT